MFIFDSSQSFWTIVWTSYSRLLPFHTIDFQTSAERPPLPFIFTTVPYPGCFDSKAKSARASVTNIVTKIKTKKMGGNTAIIKVVNIALLEDDHDLAQYQEKEHEGTVKTDQEVQPTDRETVEMTTIETKMTVGNIDQGALSDQDPHQEEIHSKSKRSR